MLNLFHLIITLARKSQGRRKSREEGSEGN
jgi:hypothetical protein